MEQMFEICRMGNVYVVQQAEVHEANGTEVGPFTEQEAVLAARFRNQVAAMKAAAALH